MYSNICFRNVTAHNEIIDNPWGTTNSKTQVAQNRQGNELIGMPSNIPRYYIYMLVVLKQCNNISICIVVSSLSRWDLSQEIL